MVCDYGYDTKNRLTAIEYKDGTTVLDGFYYELDDTGNITKTTNEDGSYWDYSYDDRYRLLTANRFESGGNIKAAYAYTYDDGDNMLTKVEPFFDDFNDGNYTGWTISGTMSASNNYLASTGTGAPIASKSNTDASNEITLRYRIENTSDSLTRAYIDYRFTDWNNYEWVRIFPSQINIGKNVAGVGTQIASGSATSTANTWYNLRIVADGATVKVWRWADGAMPTLVCSTTSSPNQSTSAFKISVVTGYLFDFDDIRILADSLTNTTTFAVNNANELTTMADYNGTTSFGFDDWGRMTNRARGGYSASYGYKYGQLLAHVGSTLPDYASMEIEYSANKSSYSYTVQSTTIRERWLDKISKMSDESSSGQLLRVYLQGQLGRIDGPDSESGSLFNNSVDYEGTVSEIFDQSKIPQNEQVVSPFGTPLATTGSNTSSDFALLKVNMNSQLLSAKHRIYDSNLGRWLTRDPVGFTGRNANKYAYVNNSPLKYVDPLGLYACVYCVAERSLTCTSTQDVAPPRRPHPDFYKPGCHAGRGGVDDPLQNHVENEGPIPAGNYTVGPEIKCNSGGKYCHRALTPADGPTRHNLQRLGRGGFEVHGWGAPGDSIGCIGIPNGDINAFNSDMSLEEGDITLTVRDDCDDPPLGRVMSSL